MEEESVSDKGYVAGLKTKGPAIDLRPEGQNQPSSPDGALLAESRRSGRLIIGAPVLLEELSLQIDVDTTITLPEPAIEIRRVHKRLNLAQCAFLQDTNKLCVRGSVRKNIEYATVTSAAPFQVSGAIKHTTIDIPFSAVAPIDFVLALPPPPVMNDGQGFEHLEDQDLPARFPERGRLESGDLPGLDRGGAQSCNGRLFCELAGSRIVEYDEFLNCTPLAGGLLAERQFDRIEEKMAIFLSLKIFQRQ